MKGGQLRAFKDRVESVGTGKNFARDNPVDHQVPRGGLMISALDRRREGGDTLLRGERMHLLRGRPRGMRRKPGMVGACSFEWRRPSTMERGFKIRGKNLIESTPIGLDRVRAGWVHELVTTPWGCGLGRQSGGGHGPSFGDIYIYAGLGGFCYITLLLCSFDIIIKGGGDVVDT